LPVVSKYTTGLTAVTLTALRPVASATDR
jgi:hypothetical protein